MKSSCITQTNLSNKIHQGKVRDTYDLEGGRLLIVATDRISAFDVVLPTGIPNKGCVLSRMAAFWFDLTAHLIPHHLIALTDNPAVDLTNSTVGQLPDEIISRSMIVHRAERVDIECIVRGYLAGSAWTEYRKNGTIFGSPAQSGMQEGEKFPEPIFTPTTKAEEGHDEDISIQEVADLVGTDVARELEEKSIKAYEYANEYAAQKGIILADTKLEFGFIDGQLSLIDEIFTPDSSRFWDAEGYAPGRSQPNFDKQFVRDWLTDQGWDREPPGPPLPEDVVAKTEERYEEAYQRLTGRQLSLD